MLPLNDGIGPVTVIRQAIVLYAQLLQGALDVLIDALEPDETDMAVETVFPPDHSPPSPPETCDVSHQRADLARATGTQTLGFSISTWPPRY